MSINKRKISSNEVKKYEITTVTTRKAAPQPLTEGVPVPFNSSDFSN